MLRKVPRLASWSKSTDLDQVRLREYLEDTAELLAPHLVASNGRWALLLEVGLPPGRDLVDMADLDNYAFPLATRLRNGRDRRPSPPVRGPHHRLGHHD